MSMQAAIRAAMVAHGEQCGARVREIMEAYGEGLPMGPRLALYVITAEWLAQIAQKQVRECEGVK